MKQKVPFSTQKIPFQPEYRSANDHNAVILKCPLTFMAMASHPQRNGGKHEQRNTMSKLANTLHLWYKPKVAIEGMI